jgi:hypothetical protein
LKIHQPRRTREKQTNNPASHTCIIIFYKAAVSNKTKQNKNKKTKSSLWLKVCVCVYDDRSEWGHLSSCGATQAAVGIIFLLKKKLLLSCSFLSHYISPPILSLSLSLF